MNRELTVGTLRRQAHGFAYCDTPHPNAWLHLEGTLRAALEELPRNSRAFNESTRLVEALVEQRLKRQTPPMIFPMFRIIMAQNLARIAKELEESP